MSEKLKNSNKNPWYVLATIYGEQVEGTSTGDYDKELAATNRRAWNGWFCGGLDEKVRKVRAEKIGLELGELAPLCKVEREEIETQFAARMGDEKAKPPKPTDLINFRDTYFVKYVFEKEAFFN